ncbi:MAG: hypothetical protein ACRCT8_12270 [Lacipirellulaceae bacterium]
MLRISTATIVMIVVLRLAVGWHFFNEGYKKLEPGFSSAGFLRGAKGPLAPLFQSMVTGPYGAFSELASPQELGARPAAEQTELNAWVADYGRRAAEATKKGQPLPRDFPDAAPFAKVVKQASAGWGAAIDRVSKNPEADPKMLDAARAAQERRLGELVNYLAGQLPAIEDNRHLAWRVERMQEEAGWVAQPPFQRDLVQKKSNEVWGALQPWAKNIQQIDASFADDVVAAASASESKAPEKELRAAVAERSMLRWVDKAVTCTVLSAGICMFIGGLTPVAGVVGAGFLFSVMATQPPWAAGADTTYVFYQLVEAAALLFLAAVGAGRWAGLDGLFHGMFFGRDDYA